jgi:hypothetical protein
MITVPLRQRPRGGNIDDDRARRRRRIAPGVCGDVVEPHRALALAASALHYPNNKIGCEPPQTAHWKVKMTHRRKFV